VPRPIVYTVSTCPASIKLKEDWTGRGQDFEERQTDQNQKYLDEALKYADSVPIVVYEDGRVEVGYKDMIG
jgi:glutaredoxin